MTLQPSQQAIAIHILTKFSSSTGNQATQFGQIIEYNIKNIFIQKSYSKCCGEAIPRTFSKKLNLSISLNQWPKVLSSLFLLYVKLRTIELY